MQPKNSYRPDIDGLRAIAILAVVGYHLFPQYIPNGFIGVDIFFVISGFLISGFLFQQLQQNQLSFIDFYQRRIRRIFPALLIVLLLSLLAGWFLLLPDEYQQLGKYTAGGAGFMANWVAWMDNNYFNHSAETKPLLHLWSLGVEEQFYLIYPILLWLVWKLRFKLNFIIVLLLLSSFTFNILIFTTDPLTAFYSPLSRFWELMLGSLVAYYVSFPSSTFKQIFQGDSKSSTILKQIQPILGLELLLLSFLNPISQQQFPGWWALSPTLGTALLISSSTTAWVNQKVLSHPWLVALGLISYPLYLWHWSILSFTHILLIAPISSLLKLGILIISVILAWLTYQWVEKPLRAKPMNHLKLFILIGGMLITGSLGYFIFQGKGFEFRAKDRLKYLNYYDNNLPQWHYFKVEDIAQKYRFDCNFYNIPYLIRQGHETRIPLQQIHPSCYQKNLQKTHTIFLWGDSHVEQLYFGLKNYLPSNWQILMVASFLCSPITQHLNNSTTDYCQKSNWFALQSILKTKPDLVLIGQYKGHNLHDMHQTNQFLKQHGIQKVLFTGPVPYWSTPLPKLIVRHLWYNTPQRTYQGSDLEVIKANLALKASLKQEPSIQLIDLIDPFCNIQGCLTYIHSKQKQNLTTWDNSHLTPAASNYLAKNYLGPIILKEVKTDP